MRFAATLLAVATAAGLTGQAPAPARKRVAVFDFDNAAQSGMTPIFFQTTLPNVGKAAADLLIARLVRDGIASVIERSALDKLLAEQNLSNSDRANPATAAKLGRILGVDAIILGTITHYDLDDKTTGGGPNRFGFGGGMKTKHDIKATVQISTRLVSPDTAEVLSASEGRGEVARKGVKEDIRDMNRIYMGGGASSIGNSVMNEAMDKAITQLAVQLAQNIPKLPRRSPVINGLVADANPSGRLVLNVGSQDGLSPGDRLQVWRAGKEIRDPASGKLLMRDDTLLGEAVVTAVTEISSIAMYKGTEAVKVGDLVKSLPKHP